MRSFFDVQEKTSSDRQVLTIRPRGVSAGHRHILYLHGGGFVMSITELHWDLIGKLSKRLDATVVVPLYPLAPEKTAPDVFEFLLPLYADLIHEAGPKNVVLIGDSAGGNLALSLAMQARDVNLQQPAGSVLLSPGLDFSFSDAKQPALDRTDPILDLEGARRLGLLYAGDLDVRDPMVSPLYGSLRGLAPLAVFTGTRDLVNPDAHRLQDKAKEESIPLQLFEYSGMVHVWMLFPMPEANLALDQIVGCVEEFTSN
ncbi:alpha/beta hydrolase [Sphaerisporangium corydalis]|uniref:Alpha/beta hydrolase n=2 Tax=Sphaerisporangium corydalis TaxID=1441875 RepID=A0ABV9EJV1_9ACTN